MEMEVEENAPPTRLGVSNYDYHYLSCRCAYCNKVVILENNVDTLEILYQEELENERNIRNDPHFYHTASEADRERDVIQERERGTYVAHEQCLHYRCLVELQDEKKEVLAHIELANRQNIELPDTGRHFFYALNYSNVRLCLNYCAYCRLSITKHATGFAYCEKADNQQRGHYLHYACFDALTEERCRVRKEEVRSRKQSLHFLTTMTAENQWKSLNVEKLASRNEAWLSFLSKYELDIDERDTFMEWIDAGNDYLIKDSDKEWCKQQKTTWDAIVTEDIIALVIKMGSLSDEDLDEKEKETPSSTTPPYLLRCSIAAPKTLPSKEAMPLAKEDTCIRYRSVPLPRQLILNLIKTIKQGRREIRIVQERARLREEADALIPK